MLQFMLSGHMYCVRQAVTGLALRRSRQLGCSGPSIVWQRTRAGTMGHFDALYYRKKHIRQNGASFADSGSCKHDAARPEPARLPCPIAL